MTRVRWAVLLIVVGGVLLIASVTTSLTGVSEEGTGCGSVIAPVHNPNARIDRVCDSALSDRSSTSWALGLGGLAAVGAGAWLRWNGIARR